MKDFIKLSLLVTQEQHASFVRPGEARELLEKHSWEMCTNPDSILHDREYTWPYSGYLRCTEVRIFL